MARLRVPITPRDHVLGDDNAPVTVVEYGDYECPSARQRQRALVHILQHFGDQLRFVYRHFPLVEVHPVAGPAAEAAEFAGSRGLFWQMHQSIFANQPRLSVPLLVSLAAQLKLSPVDLRDALAAGTFRAQGPGRFHRRCAKRRQWNAGVLRQRRAARQPLWRCHSGVGDRSGDHCRHRVIGKLWRPIIKFRHV